ncbi:hypothetical protein DENSPDRAFT_232840 [Dentipellis sp. KUC8613]|nr:hypothetical protein DENSPDRAFT_232840 [Dentipellis sp. KUC8613]
MTNFEILTSKEPKFLRRNWKLLPMRARPSAIAALRHSVWARIEDSRIYQHSQSVQ